MSHHYAVVSARIRQELQDIQRVVERVERAITAAQKRPEDQDLYLDAARSAYNIALSALNDTTTIDDNERTQAILDHFGLLGVDLRPLTRSRIVGMAVLLFGVWLIVR